MFVTKNLYQNDDKWKNVRLGDSSTETIGSWGCLLTSVTMMLNGLGYNETPVTVNDKMRSAGGFDGAVFLPAFIPYIYPNVVYKDWEPCEGTPAPIDRIDAALAAGKPVILQVDWSKDAGIQTHFVLVKEKKGNDYALYDPYKYSGDGPDKEVLLTTRYKYNGATITSEISTVVWFEALNSAPTPPPDPVKVPVPAERYLLYAAIDDLALRDTPSVSGYLWKHMLGGTELISLEPKTSAQAKVGQSNQWIQVQDPTGDQGYCAAWYVTDIKPGTEPEEPAAVPASSSSSVPPGSLALVPTEEVSFRTQPVVSPDTLIRRVPVSEQLICTEPSSVAIPKVGVYNQWLKVKDAGGKEGYVAAWYVKYASGASTQASSAATPVPAGATLKVKASVEGVAFRSQPVISDATLIRRVPINTEFTVTEANAEGKIGAYDQWLKVKDAAGQEGYVAAWFVYR